MFDGPAAPERPCVSTDEILDQTPALRAYATSLARRKPDVDDLFQETMLKALSNVSRYEQRRAGPSSMPTTAEATA